MFCLSDKAAFHFRLLKNAQKELNSETKQHEVTLSRPVLFIPPEWQQTQTPLCWTWAACGSGLAQKPNFRQSSVSLVPWLCCCKPSAQLHSQPPALGINHGVPFGWSSFCSTSQLFRLRGRGLRSACQELHHIDSNKTLAKLELALEIH